MENSNGLEDNIEKIEQITLKKDQLLGRLQKLTERVKILEDDNDNQQPVTAKSTAYKFDKNRLQTFGPFVESPLPPNITTTKHENNETKRVLEHIRQVLSDKRHINEDSKRQLHTLNDIQNRARQLWKKIDVAEDSLRMREHKDIRADSNNCDMVHLFSQLGICLKNTPAQDTLNQLWQQYDIVLRPYLC